MLPSRGLIFLCLLCAPAWGASQNAVLRNGFSITHATHQSRGEVTRLFLSEDQASFVDVPTQDISAFEPVPEPSSIAINAAEAVPDPAPAPAPALKSLKQLVEEAAARHRVDADLLATIIHVESGANPHAVSRKGAKGLMQLMPGTAQHLGVKDAFDAEANLEGGTRYFRDLLERYDFNLIKALAAYNAGPESVAKYRGVPPYSETRRYVAAIVREFNRKKAAPKDARTLSPDPAAVQRESSSKAPSQATAKSGMR